MATQKELESLQIDREDLTAIIELRFGEIPQDVQNRIESIKKREILERMIVVAANAASWKLLMEEMFEEQDSFRIVGEQFNPTG